MRIVALILLIFSFDVGRAEEPTVYKLIEGYPTWLNVSEDYIYISYTGPRSGGIFRYNLNSPEEESVVISKNIWETSSLFRSEEFLLTQIDFNQKDDPGYYSRLVKFDLSSENFKLKAYGGSDKFVGLCYNGNGEIYYTKANSNEISKFTLVDFGSVAPKLIYSQYENPTSVLFHNHNLWVMHDNGTKISKLTVLTADRVSTEVFSDLPPSKSMKAVDNYAYITQHYENKIFRFNLDDPNPEIEEVVQFDINAFDSEYYKGDLYYTLKEEQKVMVLRNVVTSIDIPEFLHTTISPNPSSDFVSLTSLTSPTTIEVYNSSGELVITKHVNPNEEIDISHLVNGTYTIRTEKNLFGRFVKID